MSRASLLFCVDYCTAISDQASLSASAERRHGRENKMEKKVVHLAGERGGIPQLRVSVR